MAWCDDRTIDVGNGEKLNALWHCFGVKDEIVDEDTAKQMLRASQTSLLPINCHRLDESGPIIGHGSIRWDDFKEYAFELGLVPCLNINLQTTAQDALVLAWRAQDVTGIDLVKLEVLTDDLTRSNDEHCLTATHALLQDGFRVMPLMSDDVDAVREAADMNVPLIRVMGSPIGSGRGIVKPHALRQIVAFGKPVILDGGIGYNGHVLEAMRLGCAGVLVNSWLFQSGDPVGTLRHVRSILRAWKTQDWEAKALAGGVAPEWVEWYKAR